MRVQLESPLEYALSAGPVPFVAQHGKPQRRMSVCQSVIQLYSPLGRFLRLREKVTGRAHPIDGRPIEPVSQPGVGHRVSRIQADRFPEKLESLAKILVSKPVPVIP